VTCPVTRKDACTPDADARRKPRDGVVPCGPVSLPDGPSPGPRLQLATTALTTPARPVASSPLTPAQRADIQLLSVDRSHFARYPMPRWSTEGERGDAYVSRIHRETTISERIEAWRALFAKTTKS